MVARSGFQVQEFLRRNFFLVRLATLGVLTYMAAAVTGEFVAAFLLKAYGGMGREVTLGPLGTQKVRPDPPASLASITLDRNPFDAEPVVQPEASEEEGEAQEDTSLLDLDVTLLGILVSNRPEWSLATIKAGGESKLVRVGSMVLDRAEVVEIASRYIVLQAGDKKRVVKLWAERSGEPSRPSSSIPRPPPPVATSTTDATRGVKKVGPYEYQIDRGMLEENLQDLTKLGMDARIIPNYVDGKYRGFRLVGIRPDSLYRAIGLESGDLILRVNGQDIDTPNKAIQLFEQLRSSPTITVDVERRGQKVTLTYQVK